MSVIYVDQLVIRLPSDARNEFNPSYAFGGASGRSLGQVMGLREAQSGHLLLPMDAEGNIIVTPGQHYTVVMVREAKSVSAATTHNGAATTVANGKEEYKNKNQESWKQQQQHQNFQHLQNASERLQKPNQKQPSSVRDVVSDARPSHEQPQSEPPQAGQVSKQQRKAARVAARPVENTSQITVSSPAAVTTESEERNKKKQRPETERYEAAAEPPQHRHAPSKRSSPPAVAAASPSIANEEEDSNDVPLMHVYAASQPQPQPSSAATTQTNEEVEVSSKNSHKHKSPRTRPESTVAVSPPTAVRRTRSSSGSRSSSSEHNDKEDEEGSLPFSQLYSAPVSAPVTEATTVAVVGVAKKRRASPEKKSPKESVPAPAAVTTPTHSPKHQHRQQKWDSPEMVPVTLPQSGRGSLVRRAPLDASSDSDSN